MDGTLTLARRANGWLSSAHVSATFTAQDHEQQCSACRLPGQSVLSGDAHQDPAQSCPESVRLRRIEQEQGRADRAWATGADPLPLTPDDQALLTAQLYDWLAARPHIHDQTACVGPTTRPGTLIAPGQEPPQGTTLSTAAAVCHLAGYTLHTSSVEAAAPDEMTVYIPRKATELLGLNETQAFAVLFTPSSATAMGRLAQLANS